MKPQSPARIEKRGPSRLRHPTHKPETLNSREFENLLRRAARFFEKQKSKETRMRRKKKR
jgi:hypothetical protein